MSPVSSVKSPAVNVANQLSLIPEPSEIEKAIAAIDPDDLSPKQALAFIYQLKKQL
ncbi:hypothetical protein P4S72_12220 [Vibrio sp. PP-XX7]